MTADGNKIQHYSSYRQVGDCWTFNNSAIKYGGHFTILASNCWSSANASFTIEGLSFQYECSSYKFQLYLNVCIVKPVIELEIKEHFGCLWKNCTPVRFSVLKGQDVVIPYHMRGFPFPTVRCMKYSEEKRHYLDATSEFTDTNSTHMILRNVTHTYSGMYRMRITNTIGSHKVTFQLEVTEDEQLVTACLSTNANQKMCPLSGTTPGAGETNHYFSKKTPRPTTLGWLILAGDEVKATDVSKISVFSPTALDVNGSQNATAFIVTTVIPNGKIIVNSCVIYLFIYIT